jgi:signal transduction histidine kinase
MSRQGKPGRSTSGQNSSRKESVSSLKAAVAAGEKQVRAGEETAAQVRLELEALMDALREANEHLIIANLRSEALAEQMSQLYQEAKTAIQAKDDFFALISHELRTPLTSITGWASLLERDPNSATVAEAARSIASSAALQAQLVDDLLDVSRIMTGKFEITREEIDLKKVVDDAVSAMHPVAAGKGVSLRTKAQQSIIIRGDAGRLRQVIGNLLSNAVKFTPAGGLVEISLVLAGSFAVVEVCDTGEGIPSNFLPYVFERLSQATAKRFAGLGLGLAIVKHIVELHGGSIAAASQGQGKGATFTIRIPVRHE